MHDFLSNPRIYALLVFATGVVAGSFATHKYLKVVFDERMQLEAEEIRDHYQKKAEKPELTEEVSKDQPSLFDSEETPQAEAATDHFSKSSLDMKSFAEYAQKVKPYRTVQEEYVQEYVPAVITAEEYMDSMMGYDKITLTYFAGDDVVANQNEEILDDIARTLGTAFISEFKHGEVDEVYVRNARMATDYELVYEPGGYSEVVLGIIPEESIQIVSG